MSRFWRVSPCLEWQTLPLSPRINFPLGGLKSQILLVRPVKPVQSFLFSMVDILLFRQIETWKLQFNSLSFWWFWLYLQYQDPDVCSLDHVSPKLLWLNSRVFWWKPGMCALQMCWDHLKSSKIIQNHLKSSKFKKKMLLFHGFSWYLHHIFGCRPHRHPRSSLGTWRLGDLWLDPARWRHGTLAPAEVCQNHRNYPLVI